MKSLAETWNKYKWCKFHKDHGYDTEDFIQLKKEIEKLLDEGHLREYIQRKHLRGDEERDMARMKTST